MTQAFHDNPEIHDERVAKMPLDRMGQPEDIAAGILYLAYDESSFVTGAELVIDVGMTAQRLVFLVCRWVSKEVVLTSSTQL